MIDIATPIHREVVPEHPTTEQLHELIKLSNEGQVGVADYRERISQRLNGESQEMLAIIGACSMPRLRNQREYDERQLGILANEEQQTLLLDQEDDLIAIQRSLPWKSRSKPERSWNGLETTNPYLAQAILTSAANHMTAVTMELGHGYHINRYGHLLAMAWIGSRSLDNAESLALDLLEAHGNTPVGVKNGVDGDVEPAIELVNALNEKYSYMGKVAFLVYRGGENAQDPDSWEEAYKNAHRLTNGQLIVDAAHGSEMAHNPGYFAKSVVGQRESLAHIIRLAQEGLVPMGVMVEGSDLERVVDPHLPFDEAKAGVLHLTQLAA